MSLYLVFGLNVGNVGRMIVSRPSTKVLLRSWNQHLSASQEVRLEFSAAFGHTGNYVLRAPRPEDLDGIVATLARNVPTHRFVVFDHTEFLAALDLMRRALIQLPPAVHGRRWTSGLVMDSNPHGGIPPIPPSDDKSRFGLFAVPRIRIVWKGDVLDSQENKLNNAQREGGWGSLSDRMRKVAGGTWTARSMKSVEGIVAVARSIR